MNELSEMTRRESQKQTDQPNLLAQTKHNIKTEVVNSKRVSNQQDVIEETSHLKNLPRWNLIVNYWAVGVRCQSDRQKPVQKTETLE